MAHRSALAAWARLLAWYLLRRWRDTYEYAWLFCSVLLALLANTTFFVPANRRRTQERPKPRRLHRSEAQLSRLHFPPSRLNYCIKMPIEVGALPLSTQLFINNEFVDAKSGTKVRAATAPRGHLRSACSVRAGPLTTAPCSSTPSTRRPRR